MAACGDARRWGSAARVTRAMPDDVDVEHPVPLVVVVGRDVAGRADAGVVDDDVDAAELVDDRGDRRVDRGGSVMSHGTREHAVAVVAGGAVEAWPPGRPARRSSARWPPRCRWRRR